MFREIKNKLSMMVREFHSSLVYSMHDTYAAANALRSFRESLDREQVVLDKMVKDLERGE